MRVAGEEVDMLAGRLRVIEPRVDQLARMQAQIPVIHCVLGTRGVRQRLVHAGDDGADAGVGGQIAIENSAEPVELRVGKFIVAGIVEGDEIDAIASPVVPRAQRRTIRAVGFTLIGDLGAVEEAREFVDIALARHRADGFMIATAEEDGK